MPQIGTFLVAAGTSFASTAVGSFLTTTFVGKLLTSVALSALAQALAPRPRAPGITTTQTQTGGTNPVSFILGRYATAGYAVSPAMSHGKVGKTPNAYLTYVVDFGDVPGCAVNRVMVDGEYADITATVDPVYGNKIGGRFDGFAWLIQHDGSQVAADTFLIATYGAADSRPWQADMIGTGVPYAALNFRFKTSIFSGMPTVRFEVDGIPVYDPRLDSTAGGSGTHRWGNVATYERSSNPMVMIYNILRGISLPDGSIWGGDALAADLPAAEWFAAMNECDEEVAVSGGGTEPRYRAGIEVTVDQEPAAVIEELLKSCSGQLVDMGGTWKPRVGGPGLPVLFITDDDLIATKAQDFSPFPGLQETFNGVSASYPEPDSMWEAKEAPPRYNEDWEAEDGDRRLIATLSLPAVPYGRQVQRLQRALAADHRRMRRHVLTLPPMAAVVEPLDAIAWTSERNGYVSKVFEVNELAADQVTLLQQVTIRERDPNDYDWSADFELPSVPGAGGTVVPPIQVIPEWGVQAITLPDSNGDPRRVAIRMAWNGVDQDDVRAVRWQIREVVGNDLISAASTHDVDGGQAIVSDGIVPATQYKARGRFVAGRETDWTDWISVTTADLRLGASDIADEIIQRGIDNTAAAAAAAAAATAANANAEAVRTELDQAKRAALGGWLADPIFAQWASGNLVVTNWSDRTGIATYGSEFAGEFGSGLYVNVPSGSSTVQVYAKSAADSGLPMADVTAPAVVISILLDYIGGDPGGTRFRAQWSADGSSWTNGNMLGLTAPAGSFTEHGISPSPGVLQAREVLVLAPAGTWSYLRLILIAKVGSASAAQEMKIHALNIRAATEAEAAAGNVASLSASVTAQGTAISTLQTGAAAGYLIRAQAGGAVSLIDLIAADGGGGTPTSIVKISATDILLDGSVAAQQLVVYDFSGNLIGNPTFDYGDLRGWTNVATTFEIVARGGTASAQQNSPTPYLLKINTDSSLRNATAAFVSVAPGDRFSAKYQYAAGGTPRDVSLRASFGWYDADGVSLGFTYCAAVANYTGTAWQTATSEADDIEAPTGAARAEIRLVRVGGGSGTAFVTNLEVIRQRDGVTLIRPGSITTDLVTTTDFIAWSTALFGGTMQSTNYSAGSTGWKIDNAGNAELNSLTVRTDMMATNAITVPASATSTTSVGLTISYQTILQATLTREAARTAIYVSVKLDGWSNAQVNMTASLQLLRGTTVLATYEEMVLLDDWAGTTSRVVSFIHIDTNTGTGSTTYYLKAKSSHATGTFGIAAARRSLVLEHVKK